MLDMNLWIKKKNLYMYKLYRYIYIAILTRSSVLCCRSSFALKKRRDVVFNTAGRIALLFSVMYFLYLLFSTHTYEKTIPILFLRFIYVCILNINIFFFCPYCILTHCWHVIPPLSYSSYLKIKTSFFIFHSLKED